MKLSDDSTAIVNDDDNSYSLPNTLAVLSLLASFFSPLAILFTQMLFLPFIALAAGVIAIFLLKDVKSTRTALPLAVVGVLISCTFGAWGAAQTKFKYDFYYRTAADYGEKWMKMLADDNREEAFEMHLNEGYRQLDMVDLKAFYSSDAKARSAMEIFYDRPGMAAIQKRGTGANWKYAGRRGIKKIPYGDAVKIAMRDDSGPRPLTVIVTFVRNPGETADNTLACWNVQDVEVEA
jgi:hypothetical protein